jgi:hypothetical protein
LFVVGSQNRWQCLVVPGTIDMVEGFLGGVTSSGSTLCRQTYNVTCSWMFTQQSYNESALEFIVETSNFGLCSVEANLTGTAVAISLTAAEPWRALHVGEVGSYAYCGSNSVLIAAWVCAVFFIMALLSTCCSHFCPGAFRNNSGYAPISS